MFEYPFLLLNRISVLGKVFPPETNNRPSGSFGCFEFDVAATPVAARVRSCFPRNYLFNHNVVWRYVVRAP